MILPALQCHLFPTAPLLVVPRGSSGGRIRLPARITAREARPIVSDQLPRNPSLEIVERAYLHWILQSEGGTEVPRIDLSTLYRKLVCYGLQERSE